jgi:hypothetical protein
MQAKTVSWNDIRPQVLDNPEVQAEYEALEEEFKLRLHLICKFTDSHRYTQVVCIVCNMQRDFLRGMLRRKSTGFFGQRPPM